MYDATTTTQRTNGFCLDITFARKSPRCPIDWPVLAAQFGFLPGLLWLVIGVCLWRPVHDFMIAGRSIRRKGKSLAEMARTGD